MLEEEYARMIVLLKKLGIPIQMEIPTFLILMCSWGQR
jgi:hypothetical protein